MAGLRAGILSVGDELLLGSTVDTNGAWLGRRLDEIGVPVAERAAVGDTEPEIRRGLEWLRERVSFVVVTGGLGPTPDDRTRESVAAALGVELGLREDLLEGLRERFRAHGFEDLPAGNARQALAPPPDVGAVLANRLGSAPGLWFDGGPQGPVVCLPGVPLEMRALFDEQVEPRLRAWAGSRLDAPRHRFIHTHSLAESVLASRVDAALPEGSGPVGIAFLPRLGAVDVRLSVAGLSVREAEAALDRVEEALRPVVAGHRHYSRSGDLAEAVLERLRERGLTLAVAESCTAGRICHRLTVPAGASDVFLGGVVAYHDDLKVGLLDVPRAVISEHGAVSRAVVEAMARGVAAAAGADCGIGVSGIAGPDGGSEEKPVGTVWYAALVRDRLRAEVRRFPGDRDGVRERSAQAALGLLHSMLLEAE